MQSSGIGLLGYSNLLYIPSATSLILCLIQSKYDNKKIYTALIPLACILVLDFFLVSRTISFSFTLLYLIVGMTQFQKNFKKLFVLIILFGSIPILSSELSRKNYTYDLPVSVQQLIDYNAGPIIAFDKNIHLIKEPTFGAMSFYGFKEIINMLPIISLGAPPKEFYFWDSRTTFITNDFNYYERGLNTFSWILYLYLDFGFIGLFYHLFLVY